MTRATEPSPAAESLSPDEALDHENSVARLNAVVIIPTLNAGPKWSLWLEAFTAQDAAIKESIFIDSSSTDDTPKKARDAGFKVVSIPRSTFNHGGTRQDAIDKHVTDAAIAIFLTQDALLEHPDSLAKLIEAFQDHRVAAAYGRQMPHSDANPIGAHARLFNYPDSSRTVSEQDIPRLGIKAAFLSNSFAAYRVDRLREVGGFPRQTIMNEDLMVSAKLLLAGYRVAYRADAIVRHSHNYTVSEEFRRYFDIGVFFSREPWIKTRFGAAEGEGLRYVKSEVRYLWRCAPWLVFSALIRTLTKYCGYRLGSFERYLPQSWKRYLSLHSHFWA